MYKKILIVIVFISFVNIVSAQNKISGGFGYFMLGKNRIDIKELNSVMGNKGYPKLSDRFTSIGVGGHAIVDRWIIGGEGQEIIGEEVVSGDYRSYITAGYGLFNLGYIVYSKSNFNFYPIFGFGGGGVELRIVERVSPTFDEVLDNPKKMVELSTGGLLLQIAFGVDYLLSLGKDEKGKGGLVFGLRIGYIFTPFNTGWLMDLTKVAGGPQVGINGPYISLMVIGGGGYGRK